MLENGCGRSNGEMFIDFEGQMAMEMFRLVGCRNVGRGLRQMSLRVQAGRNVQKRFEKKDANDGLAG